MADQRTHEPDLRSTGGIVALMLGVATLVVLSCLLLWWGYGRMSEPAATAAFPGVSEPPPGKPRLQVTPEKDLAELERRARRRLDSVGWVDREAGIVHMPVERAMTLLAQRGLPREGGDAKEVK